MSLINIERTIELDVYDHDTTPSVIKAIQLDEGTRAVYAVIQNSRQGYDIGQNAEVKLTVLRPDKTRVQITGQTFSYTGMDSTMYGAKADLSDVALAVKGNLKAQFKITSGDQELRTEIFTINNGEALDAGDGDWAGDLDGHNLDEMAQDIEDVKAAVSEMESDVSDLKSGLNVLEEGGLILKDDVIAKNVTDWLDEHPEATTTVQDGAITRPKLSTELREDLANNNKRVVVKNISASVDGHTYVAFSSGVIFNGKEIYANRYGYNHVASSNNDYGKIGIIERDQTTGEFSAPVYIDVDSSITDDLRDPNITVFDGYNDILVLSCFGLLHNSSGNTISRKSYFFTLDTNYKVLSWCAVDDILLWGNTLLTPTGYIIRSGYTSGVHIYKSDSVFNGNFNGMTFSNVETVVNDGNATEATLGYINDQLLLMSRVNDAPTVISYTSDKEGLSGWTKPIGQNYKLYAPCLLPSYNGLTVPFTATLETAEGRFPVIGSIDKHGKNIETLGIISDAPTNASLAGYTTLLPFANDNFGVMWFCEYPSGNNTSLFFNLVNFSYLHRGNTNLRVNDINIALIISENTDLNSITTPNIYLCKAKSIAETLTNCPTGNAFRLDVRYINNANNIIQDIQTEAFKFSRTGVYLDGVWSFGLWERIATHSEIQQLINIAGINVVSNCDDAKIPNVLYGADPSTANKPTASGYYIIEYKGYSEKHGYQIAYSVNTSTPKVYIRSQGASWGAWYQLNLTAVSS